MGYRIEATGEYFATDASLRNVLKSRLDVPSPITPEFMVQNGIEPVFEGPQATGGTVYQYSQFTGIEKAEDGKWYTKYVLGPIFTDNEEATAAQQESAYKARRDAEQSENVRQDRNRRLAESDWTQLADTPATNKSDWATYRQALRDLPGKDGFPWVVDWPTQPEA